MSGKFFWGAIIFSIGIVIFLQKLGIIFGDFWGYFWAVILIILGLYIMISKKEQN